MTDPLTSPPPGFFRLTRWRPLSNAFAEAHRSREAARLAEQGVRTATVHMLTVAALYREGEEAITESAVQKRHEKAKKEK